MLLNDAAMKTMVQQRLHLCVHGWLQGPLKQFVQIKTFGFGQAMPERLKFPFFFLRHEGFPPDHGWNQHGENRPRLPALMCEIRLDQRTQAAHHHLVANT